jgi:hypothetical protein
MSTIQNNSERKIFELSFSWTGHFGICDRCLTSHYRFTQKSSTLGFPQKRSTFYRVKTSVDIFFKSVYCNIYIIGKLKKIDVDLVFIFNR